MIPEKPSREILRLQARWLEAWPAAAAVWSKFLRLRPPRLCLSATEAREEGLAESFAMIRLDDQAVVINLRDVISHKLEDLAVEILAHEIGHHVLAPANLNDHARTIARMRWSLPTLERFAPLLANLYYDLLVNDRLQRSAGLRPVEVYRLLRGERAVGAVWTLYLRIYEILWGLARGVLGGTDQADRSDDRIEGDAWLGARVVRSFSRDWLDGAGRFAALFLPHLLDDSQSEAVLGLWADAKNAGAGGTADGLTEMDPEEQRGAVHPAEDPDSADGSSERDETTPVPSEPGRTAGKRPGGQTREPFQYAEILRSAGLVLTDHEAAVRYYRERARPHLIPFPARKRRPTADPLPEGLEPWDIGLPLDEADWMQSVFQSPAVIPGLTTVKRVWGETEGGRPRPEPMDLDLYVDSSGSMVNPQQVVSYPALAGAIVCLSAFRAGARVKATLWSGKNQFTTTGVFTRDEEAVLRVLTGFFGGATAFPIHLLRQTYEARDSGRRPVHIMNISDDGITTMFDLDERGESGWDIAARALKSAGASGSLVLNLPPDWDSRRWIDSGAKQIIRARDEQGWGVHALASWDDLLDFAKIFSRLRFGEGESEDA
ncbi:MAG: VWA domain-containing protein [Pseudomonadota bacterium]